MDVANVAAWLDRHAQARPDAPAFTFEAGSGASESSTYKSLAQAASAVAEGLRSRTRPADRVLICRPPGLEYLRDFLGTLWAGRAAVPVLPPSSVRGTERFVAILRAAEPALALAETAPDAGVPAWSGPTADEISAGGGSSPVDPTGPALLQFTSGSTGSPKAVVLSHRSLLHQLEQLRAAFELGEGFVCAGWLPLQHDMGLIGNVLAPVALGAPCALIAPETFLMRPGRWLELVSRTGATVSGGPDFAYALCADRVRDEELARLDLSSWRVAFTGAEPVRPATLERFARRFAPVGFREEAFFPCYGLAEASLLVASAPVDEPPTVLAFCPERLAAGKLEPADNGRRLVAHGGPHLGQRLAVVCPKRRIMVPEGEVGEIWVSGPSVGDGYFGDADSDAVFRARLDSEEREWLRTGDLGALWEGQLFVTGRVKDLLILGGRNVYPQDIEAAVESAHADLRRGGAAAFTVDDGEKERLVVVAEVERTSLRRLDHRAVERAVRDRVFRTEGVRIDEWVPLRPGGLPRTTSGKPRRSACREAYLARTLEVLSEVHR